VHKIELMEQGSEKHQQGSKKHQTAMAAESEVYDDDDDDLLQIMPTRMSHKCEKKAYCL